MSDDTPTQRFDAPLTPSTPPAATPAATPGATPEKDEETSRRLIIILIIIGAAILIALIAVLIALFAGGSGKTAAAVTPTATATTVSSPSPTPTPTQAPTPQATPTHSGGSSGSGGSQPTGGAFTVFSPTTTVACSAGGPGFPGKPQAIHVTWKTVRSQGVYFAQGNTDGASSGLPKLPANGSDANFDGEVDFPCANTSREQVYSLTLVGNDGKHVMKTWTVRNVGDAP